MQNTISPVYGAPPSVTAGAVQAMQQADLIHQVVAAPLLRFPLLDASQRSNVTRRRWCEQANMMSPQQPQLQITTVFK